MVNSIELQIIKDIFFEEHLNICLKLMDSLNLDVKEEIEYYDAQKDLITKLARKIDDNEEYSLLMCPECGSNYDILKNKCTDNCTEERVPLYEQSN